MKNLVLLSLLAVATLGSAGTLDQQNVGPSSPDPYGVFAYQNQSLVQTFTVGLAGGLDRIDLQLGVIGTPTQPLLFEVYRTAGASSVAPVGGVLASRSLDASYFPHSTVPFTAIDFASLGLATIPLSVGDTLAIRLSSNEPGQFTNNFYPWNISQNSAYAGGGLFTNGSPYGGGDAGFKTYVQAVPEPASTLALAVGLAGLAARRRSHRR